MSKLLFDSATFTSNVNNLKSSIETFKDTVEQFFINEEALRSSWKGSANEAYFNRLSEKKNEIAKVYKYYDTLIESLNQVNSEFNSIDSEFAGKFSS